MAEHKRRRVSPDPNSPAAPSPASAQLKRTMEQLASIPTLPLEVYKQITEELSKSYAIVVVKEEELDAARKAVANGAGAQRVVRERWSWLDVAGASATVRIVLEDLEAGRKHMDKLGIFIRPLLDESGKCNLLKWSASIPGPKGDWEGCLLSVTMTFPVDYPSNPPKCLAESGLIFPNCYPSGTWSRVGEFLGDSTELRLAQSDIVLLSKLWPMVNVPTRDVKKLPERVAPPLKDEPPEWRLTKLLAGIQYSLAHPDNLDPAQLFGYQLLKKSPAVYSAEARLYASLHAPSALDLVRQGRPTVLDPSVVPQGSCDWTDAVDVKSKALQTVLLDIRAAKAELDRQDFVLRPWSWNGSQVDFSKWDLGFLGAEANHFVRFRVIFPEDYPDSPPKFVSSPPLFHPNCTPSGVMRVVRHPALRDAVTLETAWGESTSDYLRLRDEAPSQRLLKLLLALRKIVLKPDLDFETQPHVVELYRSSRSTYDARMEQQAEDRGPTAEDLACLDRIKARGGGPRH